MRCSNHFCGANAIHPYHLPVVANRLHHISQCIVRIIFVGRMRFTPTICPLWQIASAPYPKALFGKGGCRCTDMVVAVVRKGWLPLFEKGGCRCSEMVGCKCHLQPSQMAFASLADGICDPCRWHLRTTSFEHRSPPLPNIDHQGFRTSFTTFSEGRRQLLRTPTATAWFIADTFAKYLPWPDIQQRPDVCLSFNMSIKVFCYLSNFLL